MTQANLPYVVKNLVPLNTDRNLTESVYKSVVHEESLVLRWFIREQKT